MRLAGAADGASGQMGHQVGWGIRSEVCVIAGVHEGAPILCYSAPFICSWSGSGQTGHKLVPV